MATGLYLWETGDYDFVQALRFHPPLTFHLASLPLLFAFGAEERAGWAKRPDMGLELAARAPPELERLRLASRLPFVLLAVWGAFLCFAWAREVAGETAGLLAAFFFSFSPMLLAHGALVHSDITSRVSQTQDAGELEIQSLSSQLEENFAALSAKYGDLEAALTEKLADLEKVDKAMKANLQQAEATVQKINATKADKKDQRKSSKKSKRH